MKTATLTALSFLVLLGTASAQTPVGTSGATASASTAPAAASTAADYRLAAGDKYANETWENACHEGNQATAHNRDLGFKWFRGVTPPK